MPESQTVIPKPASQSRTLRFNNLAMWLTGVVAALPTLLSYAIDLLGDPTISKAVSDLIPAQYRALIFAVVFVIAQRNRVLRYQTTQPIAPETKPE